MTMIEMARPSVPSNLPSLVKIAFNNARANGDLTYYPTQAAILTLGDLKYQLRFSPSLVSKPKAPQLAGPDVKPFNPFESPSPSLLIAELPPSHRLVLNKFAVVSEHFILITKDYRPQIHVLEESDIEAASACIDAYQQEGQELFAFFNSGKHSGASQPHRHIQLLPVERMRDGLENSSNWAILADRLTGLGTETPFSIFSLPIGDGMTVQEKHAAYVCLYKRAVNATLGDGTVPTGGEAKISYNFAMTRKSMALCPRVAEGASIKNRDGEDIGFLSLNGTLLAGTALVKTAAEWDTLREDSSILLDVLKQIGVPPMKELGQNL